MTRSYRSVLGLILAMALIALSCSTLVAQTAATTDNATAVALQKMQEQLDQQQQQIHRLQAELLEARQQAKAVNSDATSQATLVPASYSAPSADPAAAVAAAPEGPPPGPTVIPAIVPLRTNPIDPPKTGGVLGIKVGPTTLQPYGFVKATATRQSSNPDGDDFPYALGLFLNAGSATNTGATANPEFGMKARSTRFGLNVEWPDASPKLTLTGRIEGDFAGNFSEVNECDVTSYICSTPRLRLAFVRMDYHLSDNSDVYFLGGQDWTLFGSPTQVLLLETDGNAGFYGDARGRAPQLRGGWVQTLTPNRNVKLLLEGGITFPGTGEIGKLGSTYTGVAGGGLAVQLSGSGDRAGADSARPQVEARVALQFQLDKAKGVAPAQIMVDGFQGRRRFIVLSDCGVATSPSCPGSPLTSGEIAAATASPGFSSAMYGGQIGVQLPTRWVTAVASLYRGADMRFYAAGIANAFATQNCLAPYTTTHLLATQDGNPGAEGPATVCINPDTGAAYAAPEHPIRSFGGFAQVGFPLSRIFNANPAGRNAGWQLYFAVGKDQIVDRDLLYYSGLSSATTVGSGALPLSMQKFAAVSLWYKLNQWASFAIEQSVYASRFAFGAPAYTIAGVGSNEWQDHTTQFGPIFTF